MSQPLMAPWFKLNSGFETTFKISISALVPRPSQDMHAPVGLLKEKSLGSNSGILKPQIEHAI